MTEQTPTPSTAETPDEARHVGQGGSLHAQEDGWHDETYLNLLTALRKAERVVYGDETAQQRAAEEAARIAEALTASGYRVVTR